MYNYQCIFTYLRISIDDLIYRTVWKYCYQDRLFQCSQNLATVFTHYLAYSNDERIVDKLMTLYTGLYKNTATKTEFQYNRTWLQYFHNTLHTAMTCGLLTSWWSRTQDCVKILQLILQFWYAQNLVAIFPHHLAYSDVNRIRCIQRQRVASC